MTGYIHMLQSYRCLCHGVIAVSPAPLTPVAPVFLLMGAFLPPAGRDVAPGQDVAAEVQQ